MDRTNRNESLPENQQNGTETNPAEAGNTATNNAEPNGTASSRPEHKVHSEELRYENADEIIANPIWSRSILSQGELKQ